MPQDRSRFGEPPRLTVARAFSLLEVLVAMVVFGTGVLGVMEAFTFDTRAVSEGTRLDDAVTIAERELQRAILVSQQSMAPIQGSSGLYTWTTGFTEEAEGLVLVTIVVSWPVRGELQEYLLSRLFMPPQQQT